METKAIAECGSAVAEAMADRQDDLRDFSLGPFCPIAGLRLVKNGVPEMQD